MVFSSSLGVANGRAFIIANEGHGDYLLSYDVDADRWHTFALPDGVDILGGEDFVCVSGDRLVAGAVRRRTVKIWELRDNSKWRSWPAHSVEVPQSLDPEFGCVDDRVVWIAHYPTAPGIRDDADRYDVFDEFDPATGVWLSRIPPPRKPQVPFYNWQTVRVKGTYLAIPGFGGADIREMISLGPKAVAWEREPLPIAGDNLLIMYMGPFSRGVLVVFGDPAGITPVIIGV